MVNDLITKDIIAILAPDESIAQYEQAFIDTVEDPVMRDLMTADNERVLSRDLQSQIPEYNDDYEGENDGDEGLSEFDDSGPGTPVAIRNTGPSYATQQAIAVQLSGPMSGR